MFLLLKESNNKMDAATLYQLRT